MEKDNKEQELETMISDKGAGSKEEGTKSLGPNVDVKAEDIEVSADSNDSKNIEASSKTEAEISVAEEMEAIESTDIESEEDADTSSVMPRVKEGTKGKIAKTEKETPPVSKGAVKDLTNVKARWYILHVYSGQEQKVIENIKEAAKSSGYEECFADFLVPAHNTTEVRRGKKVDVVQKFFPGYLLIKMKMSDETRHFVKKQLKVTDFLLNNNKPQAISESEALRMSELATKGTVKTASTTAYEVGERVKVTDGPFVSFDGYVEEVDLKRERLRVTVSIFGRATPVDLEYSQVEKM